MSPFRRSARISSSTLTLLVDGETVPAVDGDSVATALLAAGRTAFAASGKTGNPLAAYCLMGVCFGCLCEIDGRPGTQACLTAARDGMTVQTRHGDDADGR